jgi:HK97 gp10 family phage protein
MQTTFRMTIERSTLDSLGEMVRTSLGRAIAKIAKDIEANAKVAVPVRTGFLKNSIEAKQVEPFSWRVRVAANYGIYVEFGTRKMPARPYFTPAVDRMRPVFEEVVRQAVERAIREATP